MPTPCGNTSIPNVTHEEDTEISATITNTPVATATATAPAVTETPVQTATAPAVTQTPAPTETPSVVSASVVSASAVNTQDEVTPLTAVTKNGKLKITFNKAIKESTVNNTTFTVTDAKGKNISLPASDVALEIGGKTVSVDLKNIGLEKNATYKLTVKGVVDAEGFAAVDYTTDFTVAGTAIIQSVRLSYGDAADELSTNMDTGVQYGVATTDEKENENITKYVKNNDGSYRVATPEEIAAGTGLYVNKNADWAGKVIKVKYDALLDATTVNAANIELTNTTTGERIPVTYVTSASDGEITITAKSTLITKNLYKLTIKGVKTAVNGNAEGLTHVFTVNGVKPFATTGATYRTIDGKAVVNNTYVWPMLAAGNKETALNDSEYFAGLQINVTAAETLDAATVEKCVYLVEKETKEIVAATVSYNAESKMITIVPKANLKEDTDYQIQYLGGLRTTDFVYLDSNKKNDVVTSQTVDFRTMDATAPEVVSIVAKSGTSGLEVAKAQEFIVTFSESVTLSDNAKQILLTETSKDVESEKIASEKVEVAVVAGTDSKQWTLKIPAETLEPNKSYKLRVLGKDAKDWASVSNNDAMIVNDGYGYAITIINNDGTTTPGTRPVPNRLKKTATYTFSTENDTTAPSLVAVYAGDDITDASKIIKETKTNVSADDKFTFVFDEEVQFKAQNVKIEVLNNGTWTAAGNASITQAKNKDNKVVGFTVTPGCNSDAKYRIVIDKGVVVDCADKKIDKCNEFDLYRYELIGTKGDDVSTAISMIANTGVNGEAEAQANDSVKVNSRFFVGLEEKDTTGISDKNLSLLDSEGNKVAGEIKEVTSTDAVRALQYVNKLGPTNSSTIYVFIPSKDLAFESTYTLVLENVKDAIGNTIEKKAITFKTAADVTRVSSIEGVKDGEVSVNRTGVFKINFNNKTTELTKNIDSTLSAGEVEIRNKVDDSVFTGYELKADTDKKVYTISFTGADNAHKLEANTTYVLKVKLADINGKANEASVTFTTGLDAKDVVKPELADAGIVVNTRKITKDKTNTVNLTSGNDIVLNYNEKLNKDDVKVEITNISDTSKSVSVLSKDLNDDSKDVLTIKTVGMLNGTGKADDGSFVPYTYKVVISGVKDEAKNEADSITFFLVGSTDSNDDLNAADALAEAKVEAKAELDEYVEGLDSSIADTVTAQKTEIDKVNEIGNIANTKTAAKVAIDNALIAAAKADTDLFPATVAGCEGIELPQTASAAAVKYGVTLTWGDVTKVGTNASSDAVAEVEGVLLKPIAGATDDVDDTIACNITRNSGTQQTVTYMISVGTSGTTIAFTAKA